jgi:c-di-AMP phosphodiesterase-like protein
MDARLKDIMQHKIDDVINQSDEIIAITRSLGTLVDDVDNVAFGIALGRVYNAFHYQTRRVLKRNATDPEFGEFVQMLSARAEEIKKALRSKKA